MNIRQMREAQERETFSKYATLSENSKGRQNFEEKCPLRTDFSRDRDRIIHSKAFRRLKHKTQVFISLDNDHFRTRLTHTLEVSQIARTIARALGLNEDLAEAISMGHDLGHTPFGHSGERALDELCTNGFRHYEQSLRVVDILEKNGAGMNLTYEVRDGIVNHTGADMAETPEGRIVKYADRIAYINHDIDDAIRAGVIDSEDIPREFLSELGETGSQRIDNLISDIVYTSLDKDDVKMSEETEKSMLSLRKFMFENVYHNLALRDSQAYMVVEKLYNHFLKDVSLLPAEYKYLLYSWDKETVVCDYIAGMTDNFCVALFNEFFMPIK